MKYLLIVNPLSGRGSNPRRIEFVLRYFRHHGHAIDVRLTAGPGHATQLARDACLADYDVIIGGGGDGTINEVLNGIEGADKVLGILPWGTGNVFASEMGFPGRLRSACRLIRKGPTALLDVGICNGRRFLLMVGAGLDAYSLKQLDGQLAKRRLGRLAYAFAAFKAFARYHFPEIGVQLPDGRSDRGSFILVSNTSRYGNFFSFTPEASPSDGRLDVFVFRKSGRWNTMLLGLRYLFLFMLGGTRPALPMGVARHRVYRTEGLSISSSKPVLIQSDGELQGFLPATIRVQPRAVRMILPRRAIRKFWGRQHPSISTNGPEGS
ncbi:MAG TPA: diacylglycerol kinase family protein [Rectinemataceae bacterium]|nr:diacylglycerol kinase family protein [Rectinemataceae bacterium]